MDLSLEELLCRKDMLEQFENYFKNATNTLNKFVEQIGWTLNKTSTNVIMRIYNMSLIVNLMIIINYIRMMLIFYRFPSILM